MRHKKAQKFNNKNIINNMKEKDENIIYIKFGNKQQEIYYNKLYSIALERYKSYKVTGNIGRGSISILSSLFSARQACSGHIYSKNEIEFELNKAQKKTNNINELVSDNKNANKSAKELYEMALVCAYNISECECPICYETPFDEPLQTICRHIFCGECIRTILSIKSECPMCRKYCTIEQLKKPPNENNNNNNNNNKMDIDDDDKKEEKKGEIIKFDTKLKF
eukprot:90699_1